MNNTLLKQKREEANYSQRRIAEEMHITTRTYLKKENSFIDATGRVSKFTYSEKLLIKKLLNLSAKDFKNIFE